MHFSEAQLTFGPDGLGGRVALLEADYSLVLYSAERKSVSSAAKKILMIKILRAYPHQSNYLWY